MSSAAITFDPSVKSHHVPAELWERAMAQVCVCGLRYGLHSSDGRQGCTESGCIGFQLKEGITVPLPEKPWEPISKLINMVGKPLILACDAKCNKAWGISSRPKQNFDPNDPDDYAFLADDELGTAPANPGTVEGTDAKPRQPSEQLNKWCARECERSTTVQPWESIVLPDYEKRLYNQPWKHKEENHG